MGLARPITVTKNKHPHLKQFRRRMRWKPTSDEKIIAGVLHKLRVKFAKQQIFYDGSKSRIADFWLWDRRCIIECDGGYHLTEMQKADDRERDSWFAVAGIDTIRLTSEQINSSNVYNKLREKILLW